MNVVKIHRTELDSSGEFGYCRKLLKEGIDKDSILEIYGTRDTYDIRISNVGRGAEMAVREDPSPHFVKYRPFPTLEGANKRRGKPVESVK